MSVCHYLVMHRAEVWTYESGDNGHDNIKKRLAS